MKKLMVSIAMSVLATFSVMSSSYSASAAVTSQGALNLTAGIQNGSVKLTWKFDGVNFKVNRKSADGVKTFFVYGQTSYTDSTVQPGEYTYDVISLSSGSFDEVTVNIKSSDLTQNQKRYYVYQIFSDGKNHLVNQFSNLNDAISYGQPYSNMSIIDENTGGIVWNNYYCVYQRWSDNQDHLINKFSDFTDALNYAKQFSKSKVIYSPTGEIKFESQEIYNVYQKWSDNQYHLINSFYDLNSAYNYAKQFANIEIIDSSYGRIMYSWIRVPK